MDACTASMCDKKWGRPGFAKVLVDVWATGELKKELEIIIPSLTGGQEERVKVGVEYLWIPMQCSFCCLFRHKVGACTKAPVVSKQKENKKDVEGFTNVQGKQWRKKGETGRHTGASTSGVKDVPMGEPKENKKEEHGGKEKGAEQVSEEQMEDHGSKKPIVTKVNNLKGDGSAGHTPFLATIARAFKPVRGSYSTIQTVNRFENLSGEDTDEERDDNMEELDMEKEENQRIQNDGWEGRKGEDQKVIPELSK